MVSSGDFGMMPMLQRMLRKYAEALLPWAEMAASNMVNEVDRSDRMSWRAWHSMSEEIGAGVKEVLAQPVRGDRIKRLMQEQVTLITSLPIEAGERVHELALQSLSSGARPNEIAAEIMRTGEVTQSRATLIARTEVSRAATVFKQVRAQAIGSTHFVWKTAGDGAVRPEHRDLAGKIFRWDDPPVAGYGAGKRPIHALPGSVFNCRCFASPVLPDM